MRPAQSSTLDSQLACLEKFAAMDSRELATMLLNEQTPAILDSSAVSNVALKVFFNITRSWGLNPQEEKILLGDPAHSVFDKWRNGQDATLPKETLKRISYIVGIYRSLRVLLATEAQANAWPRKPNSHFNGVSALSIMLQSGTTGLARVRRYLDGTC